MKYLKKQLRKLLPCKIYWPHWFLRKMTMRNYKMSHGYSFDLDNPRTFTEKILWYFTEYDCSEISKITDKVLFKYYIEEKIGPGKTIQMYGHWKNIEDFERDWPSLPNTVVLKSNIQGSGNCIKIIKDKKEINFAELKKEVGDWLKPRNTLLDDYVCRMHNSTPQILAEEYMENIDSQLFDYKVFCFDGKPYFVYVAQDHFGKEGSYISFYDLEWNKMDVRYGRHKLGDATKPLHFEEMIEISKKLSKDFPFVRVDFFDTDQSLFLAEMTFSPGGALTPYHPSSFNEKMGELLKLPIDE